MSNPTPALHNPADFLAGGGELGALIRAYDWSSSPLGSPAGWPRSLKTAVRIMLTSRQPIWIGWGPQLVYLYNDPYQAIIGGKHPWAIGQPIATVWKEIWHDIEALLSTAMTGDGTYVESQLLIMERNGYPEETYYTFSYSPIPGDDGAPAGIICANTDETQRVIGERQLGLLRELAARTAQARTLQQACENLAEALRTDARDVPFAAIYLAAPGEGDLRLASACGLPPDHPAFPGTLAPGHDCWQACAVLRSGEPRLVEALDPALGPWYSAEWRGPVRQAVVLPLAAGGESGSQGILVAGLNPFRLFDDRYRDFMTLVAQQAGAAIANAEAYQAEQRRAEALAEIDRAKTRFFSNVSHEFRTPLTLMLGPLEEALAARETLPARHGELLDLAHRNSLRLLRLVNTLLDFSRIEAGRMQAAFQPTALPEYTRELASNFELVTRRAGLALTLDCPPLAQPVWVDHGMWEKIVLNLLSNAFKFTFEGGIAVRLAPSADGRQAVLTVTDTGVGIPPHELPRLFERFHRVQGQQSRSFEGSGIGLALVQELVRQHGGSIQAASEPGRGTTFTVAVPFGHDHLPAADRSADTDAAQPDAVRAGAFVEEALRWLPPSQQGAPLALDTGAPTGAAGPRGRVVVADDNADMRDYVQRLLRGQWDVVAVANGEEALAALRAHKPDLLLTDVMMPRLDGFGLLRAVRSDPGLSDLPVIMLSARAGEESRVEGFEAGADDYLVKPFSARELVARLHGNLRLAAMRREANAALRESEVRFRNMADHAPLMMWVTDAEGRCVYLNRRWHEFTGQKAEDALGMGWLRAVHPDDAQRTADIFLAANAAREAFQFEYRLRRTDGEYRWAIDAAAPRFTGTGEFLGYIGSVIDISHRKEAEELLQELNAQLARRLAEAGEQDRRKNEFLATLAHELRNPLAPLRNGVELMKLVVTAQPQRAPEILAMMERQLSHMVRLVDDLMDVSRVSRGQVGLRRARVALAAVIDAALESSRPLVDRAGHQLAVLLPPAPAWLDGDATRLAQVFSNLLNNAVKYTPPGGRITVTAATGGATVVVEVKDDGEGIAPEMAARVFDLFVQGPQTAGAQGGLGIGLSLVRKLVELHGGVVDLHSAGRGQGTTVRVTLPLAGNEGERPAPAAETPVGAARAGRRVLVVDDNVDAADSLGMLLAGGGHEIKVVHSGRAAIDTAAAFRPELVFLDIGLPDVSGYEVAAALRRGHPAGAMRIVALTGWGNEEAREKSAASGFDLHLTKPVQMDLLYQLLAHHDAA